MTELDDADATDYTDDAATFGDRIAAARDAMGMEQAQLARRLGIKIQTLQNWEDDRSEPRANKLQMLAGVLNVSIIWLMSGEGQGVQPSNAIPEAGEIQSLVEELRQLRKLQHEVANRTLRLERRLLGLAR